MSLDDVMKVHRVRFFNADLSSINCMSFDEKTLRLALVRRKVHKYKQGIKDSWSKIEIWNFKQTSPFLEQVIHEDSSDPWMLEAIEWGRNGRLFSCGLNTFLNEYDLDNSCVKHPYAVTSGPAWCMTMDKEKTAIAVGTEDGFICTFKLNSEGLDFDKLLDRHEKRILSICWYQKDQHSFIVGGSIDFIKIWNYKTLHCVDNIRLGKSELVVWSLAVLDDFTIISGDSSGTTSFWNGKTATLISSYQAHKSDVLTVSASHNQMFVYSSGVDPVIHVFKKHQNTWVTSTDLHLHTHDVRTLKCAKSNWLFSGGVDTYLMKSLTEHPPYTQLRFAPDFTSKIHFSNHKILFQFDNYLELWALGKEEDDTLQTTNLEEDFDIILPLSDIPIKLLEIKSKKSISAAAISWTNLKWIIYGTSQGIRLYNFENDKLTKVPVLFEPILNAIQMVSFGDELIAINCGTLYILKLDLCGAVIQTYSKFDNRIYGMNGTNSFLTIGILDESYSILIYDKNLNLITKFINTSHPSVFAVNPLNKEGEVWVGYPNHKILQFSIKENKIIFSGSLTNCISYQQLNENWSVKQIAFAKSGVIFSDDNLMFKFDKSTKSITKSDKFRHVLRLGNTLVNNELIIVELTPEMLFKKLPPSLQKKKFGT